MKEKGEIINFLFNDQQGQVKKVYETYSQQQMNSKQKGLLYITFLCLHVYDINQLTYMQYEECL